MIRYCYIMFIQFYWFYKLFTAEYSSRVTGTRLYIIIQTSADNSHLSLGTNDSVSIYLKFIFNGKTTHALITSGKTYNTCKMVHELVFLLHFSQQLQPYSGYIFSSLHVHTGLLIQSAFVIYSQLYYVLPLAVSILLKLILRSK